MQITRRAGLGEGAAARAVVGQNRASSSHQTPQEQGPPQFHHKGTKRGRHVCHVYQWARSNVTVFAQGSTRRSKRGIEAPRLQNNIFSTAGQASLQTPTHAPEAVQQHPGPVPRHQAPQEFHPEPCLIFEIRKRHPHGHHGRTSDSGQRLVCEGRTALHRQPAGSMYRCCILCFTTYEVYREKGQNHLYRHLNNSWEYRREVPPRGRPKKVYIFYESPEPLAIMFSLSLPC